MIDNTTLAYLPSHMEEISSHYEQCSNFARDAITHLNNAKSSYLSNYKGQSDDTVPALCDKIAEHMELLRDCFEQMEAYATYTKDTMVETDLKLSQSMRR